MKISTLQVTLENEIVTACMNYIEKLKIELKDEKIYAFIIYGSSFSEGLNVAVATHESFKRAKEALLDNKFQVPDIYLEICADEWSLIGKHYEIFEAVDNILFEFYDRLYDGCQFDDEDNYQTAESMSENIFHEAVINAMQELKNKDCLVGDAFEKDLLLGYQFSDSTLECFADASSRLNSSYWHDKFLSYQAYCLRE